MVYGRYIELVNGLINQQTSLGGTTLYGHDRVRHQHRESSRTAVPLVIDQEDRRVARLIEMMTSHVLGGIL